MRALATQELGPVNALRVIGRETAVGLLNGLLFAVIMGAIAFYWFGSGTLGMQYPPVHLPLWQSLAWAQCEPAGEPEGAPPPEPPLDIEPPLEVEPPLEIKPPSDDEPPAPVVEP